jgi:hypothetical protein
MTKKRITNQCRDAAVVGDLVELKLLHESGCVLDCKTTEGAASSGELECLK